MRKAKLLPFDVGVTFGAYLSGLWLRFEGSVPSWYVRTFFTFIALAVAIQIGTNAFFGLYREVAQPGLARRVALAGLTAGSIIVTLDALAGAGVHVPRSVAILGAILTPIGIALVRLVDWRSRLEHPAPPNE